MAKMTHNLLNSKLTKFTLKFDPSILSRSTNGIDAVLPKCTTLSFYPVKYERSIAEVESPAYEEVKASLDKWLTLMFTKIIPTSKLKHQVVESLEFTTWFYPMDTLSGAKFWWILRYVAVALITDDYFDDSDDDKKSTRPSLDLLLRTVKGKEDTGDFSMSTLLSNPRLFAILRAMMTLKKEALASFNSSGEAFTHAVNMHSTYFCAEKVPKAALNMVSLDALRHWRTECVTMDAVFSAILLIEGVTLPTTLIRHPLYVRYHYLLKRLVAVTNDLFGSEREICRGEVSGVVLLRLEQGASFVDVIAEEEKLFEETRNEFALLRELLIQEFSEEGESDVVLKLLDIVDSLIYGQMMLFAHCERYGGVKERFTVEKAIN